MRAKRGRGGAARGRVGLHRESRSVTRSGATPTGGPRLSVGCGRGRPGRAGPEGEGGPAGKEREKESGAGRAGRERKKKLGRAKRFWAAGKKEKEREGERKLGRLG